mgnify:CR=1 FL=1
MWACSAVDVLMVYILYSELTQKIDTLTHLLNRSSYESCLASLRGHAVIYYFDVNEFKSVNDTFGHGVGDAVLAEVGSTIYAVNTDRIRGYLRGFAEFGVPVAQRLVHSGVESAGQTLDALEAALEQKADCILCGDDEVAFEVMGELRTRHILVPNDLRVASLYDSSMLASITPSVSAVQYDAEQLGKTACRMLLDRLAGKEIVMRQLEGYQVILRDSTKWRERSHSIK